MKILVHKGGKKILRIISSDGGNVDLINKSCSAALFELAESFPGEVIGWCEEGVVTELNNAGWNDVFHHDLIMASYSRRTAFFPPSIGYIDQLPFVNVSKEVLYGTWMMSSDVGGIRGKVLLKFRNPKGQDENFDYLLNSIAKAGQQKSLFCYSAPALLLSESPGPLEFVATENQLFRFVAENYSIPKALLLFWCFLRYQKKLSLFPFIKSLFFQGSIYDQVDLSSFIIKSRRKLSSENTVDVIIPTMGRKDYLFQLLKDLSKQTHLPKKVIIVEQRPEENFTELDFLPKEKWPFEVIHHFLTTTGACRARNLGLTETGSEWVFFSDDDQRLPLDTLEKAIKRLMQFGAGSLTTSYLQPGENKLYTVPKQWGTFGAGNSFIHRRFLDGIKFSTAYEHGYGEDKDFGMQLRNAGCDIIYDPEIEIEHLKAPVGGFRYKPSLVWEKNKPLPKPSPTIMVYAYKHFTREQFLGFKNILFLKYYFKQSLKNPIFYLRKTKKQWRKSEIWAKKLMDNPELNDPLSAFALKKNK